MKSKNQVKWFEYQRMLIPDISPDVNISFDNFNINKALLETKALMIRWTSSFDTEKNSFFWYVICDNYHGKKFLKKSTRSEINRGEKNTIIKIVNNEWLKKNGYKIYIKANKMYGQSANYVAINDYFKNLDRIINDNRWDIWGIESKKENLPIGYALIKKYNHSIDLSVFKIDPDHLRLRASYSLIYNILENYILKSNFKFINAGSRSIYHETNFQNFLISKFHFRKAFCKLNIIYNKRFYIIIKFLIFLSYIGIFNLLKIDPKIRALIIQDSLANEKDPKISF